MMMDRCQTGESACLEGWASRGAERNGLLRDTDRPGLSDRCPLRVLRGAVCAQALTAVPDGNLEEAMEWILNHSDGTASEVRC